ncbi:MAG: hypothetical protein ACR2PL_12720, partial [Dehalococcoidia bacterium]
DGGGGFGGGGGSGIGSITPVQVCAAGQTAPCRSFLGGVSAIAAGPNHSMALKADGTVWVWGIGFSGELGNGIRTSSPTPVQVCAAGQTAPCTSFLDRASDIGAGYSDSVALVDATTPSPSPSPSPQATTVTLSAACAPAGAAGSFGLQIGSTTSTAGCGGSNGPVTVTAGQLVTVAETIAAGSFTASLQCGSQPPVSSSGASVMATITPAAGSNTACTVTNTRCMAGDVNCSTKVDAVDALCVLRTVAALALTSACPFTPAGQTDPVWKLSTGSQISAVDALCILRSVAGLDGTAACPKLTIPQGAAASHAGPAGAPLRPTASAAPAHGSFLRPEPSLARLTAKWKA